MKYELNSKNYYDVTWIDDEKRDLVFIIPGGGYHFASDREGQIVADQFKDQGYHQAVYKYREEILLFPEIHLEAKEVLSNLKNHPKVNRIYVIGFSAGGHFAAMLSSYYYDLIDKLILCYPVITANPRYAHMGSLENLLGNDVNTDKLEEVSIEKHIHPLYPPTFIMHSMTDQVVVVENSLLLIEALKANSVYTETHLYPTGRHGLSIATKDVCYEDMEEASFIDAYGYISDWVRLAKAFLKRGIK
jgi:acetyl esterase/lipase